jgi:hypothetical protein
MKKQWIYQALLLTLVIMMVAGFAWNGQTQKRSPKTDKPVKFFPIIDYYALETTDAEALKKKQIRARRYDRSNSQPIQDSNIDGRVLNNHWSEGMSPLPASDSDVILIGTVLSGKANFSHDKASVYSDFDVQVDEALKGQLASKQISVERYGGAVRFPSGRLQKYEISGQGLPQLGQRYVFFLKQLDNDSYKIVTAYNVGEDTVTPLDGFAAEASGKYPFDQYQGFQTSIFLQLVREAISQSDSKASY